MYDPRWLELAASTHILLLRMYLGLLEDMADTQLRMNSAA